MQGAGPLLQMTCKTEIQSRGGRSRRQADEDSSPDNGPGMHAEIAEVTSALATQVLPSTAVKHAQ